MTFETTRDLDYVREILVEPKCWRIMTDDAAPSPEAFKPRLLDRLSYVIARDKGRTVAVFVLVLGAPGHAELHFSFLPASWGRATTVKTGKAFLRWIWETTSLVRLVGPVPAHNRCALALAKLCGFVEFGVEPGAVTKGGKAYDRILTQVLRPA